MGRCAREDLKAGGEPTPLVDRTLGIKFGCEVGADQGFLDTMSTGDNAVLEVKAYDKTVCTNAALSKHWPSTGAALKCSNP